MDREWRETFLTYAGFEEHQKKVESARRDIEKAIEKYGADKIYVSFSGGKDSTCVVHLTMQICPDVMVFHWDYGPYYIPREYHRAILENARKMGVQNLRVETSERYLKEGRNAKNVLGEEMIEKLLPKLYEEGYRACLVGLREEESVKRKHRTRKGESLSVIDEIFPIRQWTWMDVWAYIVANDVPYLKEHYDRYARVLGYKNVRFTTLFDSEFEKFGGPNVDGVLSWKYKHSL